MGCALKHFGALAIPGLNKELMSDTQVGEKTAIFTLTLDSTLQ